MTAKERLFENLWMLPMIILIMTACKILTRTPQVEAQHRTTVVADAPVSLRQQGTVGLVVPVPYPIADSCPESGGRDSVKAIWGREKEFFVRTVDPSYGRFVVTLTLDREGNLLLRKWSGRYVKRRYTFTGRDTSTGRLKMAWTTDGGYGEGTWFFEPDTLYGTVKFSVPWPDEPRTQWPRTER